MRLSLGPWVAWAAIGCSAEGSYNVSDRSGGDSFVTTASSTDPSPPVASEPEAAWWGFDAVIPVAGGVPLPEGAWMQVVLWAEEDRQLCRHDVPVLAIAEETAPAVQPAPLTWWRLELGDGAPSEPECEAWPSRDLWLGLAPYDPRLDAEAFEQGWDGLPVYSLLVQEFTQGQVWLAGLAGTVEQWDGAVAPVTAPPVADGEYEAHSLYLLELP